MYIYCHRRKPTDGNRRSRFSYGKRREVSLREGRLTMDFRRYTVSTEYAVILYFFFLFKTPCTYKTVKRGHFLNIDL